MKLEEAEEKVLKITEKEYVTREDYIALNELLFSINPYLFSHDKAWYNFFEKVNRVKDAMFKGGLLNPYSKENLEYIKAHAPILPLVLANDSSDAIKMRGLSYMFLCQFHKERRPSMSVTDYNNSIYCYSCKRVYNQMTYLTQIEKISFKETIQLLSQIYLYDFPDIKTSKKAKKYQDALASQKYRELLEMGRKRLQERKINAINGQSIEEFYEERYATIERVKNGINDPNFIYQEPPKQIKLNKEELHLHF